VNSDSIGTDRFETRPLTCTLWH